MHYKKKLLNKIFSMSVVTNIVGKSGVNHNEVQDTANKAVERVWLILNNVLRCV